MKVYFDNAKINEKGAVINLDVSFSGVELYIPREWRIINNADITLGGIEEKHGRIDLNGPTVALTGKVSFSGIEIMYV